MWVCASLEGVWSKKSIILAFELDGIIQHYAPATLHRKKLFPKYSLNTSLVGPQRRAVHLENA